MYVPAASPQGPVPAGEAARTSPSRPPEPTRGPRLPAEQKVTQQPCETEARTAPVRVQPLAAPAESGPAGHKPKKHFSWLAVLFLVLGLLSLGAVSAAPFLPGPDLERTRDFVQLLPGPQGIDLEAVPQVAGAPGVVALFALLCLLLGLAGKRFGFVHLRLLDLAILGSAFLLLCGLEGVHREMKDVATLQERIEQFKEEGTKGDAVPVHGLQFPMLAGGAGTACLCFTLAGTFVRRRWWSRTLAFFVLAFWPALMATWVFRQELGVDAAAAWFVWPI
jgi:hypothetical protein